jgi:hypothetical protein
MAFSDSGIIVGGGDNNLIARGFLYSGGTNGTYTYLLPQGWIDAYGYGINNNGAAVGTSNGGPKGFLYSGGANGTYS